MSEIDIALSVAAAIVMLLGLWSNPIKKSILQEPVIAMMVGVAIGPYGLDWLDLARWGDGQAILEEAVRLTIAIGLVAAALSIDKNALSSLRKPLILLLTVGMAGMWLATSALMAGILGLSFWAAILLGAVVTPTDPIVAASIVSGPVADRHLPRPVRDTISFESGANDGLAYPIVMLPILMMQQAGTGWSAWMVNEILIGTVGAAAVGAAIGLGAAQLLAHAKRWNLIESHSFLSYTIGLSLFTLGVSTLLGAEALISVFLAGLVFNFCTDAGQAHEEEKIQGAIANVLTLPMFGLLGVALPLEDWIDLGWPLVALTIAVLLLRRIPVIILISRGFRPVLGRRDSAYIAWFGPIGFAAIYYAMAAMDALGDPLIWTVTSALVFASVMIHGITATPLTRLYGRS